MPKRASVPGVVKRAYIVVSADGEVLSEHSDHDNTFAAVRRLRAAGRQVEAYHLRVGSNCHKWERIEVPPSRSAVARRRLAENLEGSARG